MTRESGATGGPSGRFPGGGARPGPSPEPPGRTATGCSGPGVLTASRPTGPGFGVEPGDSVVRGAGRSGTGVGSGAVEEPSALVEGAGIPVVSPERPPPGPLLV
ncbi:hypothetical protein [Streptomyces sp. NPDC006645]|uniref:hypothetical protein n=1 Tax=Streptomyces sp. NPDC006645 TaxID=3157184 RepID=UPI0033AAB9BE